MQAWYLARKKGSGVCSKAKICISRGSKVSLKIAAWHLGLLTFAVLPLHFQYPSDNVEKMKNTSSITSSENNFMKINLMCMSKSVSDI